MGIEQDTATIRYNTLQSKWGHDVNAVNYRNQASMARASAKNAKTAGWIGAISGLLSAAGGVAGMTPTAGTGAKVSGGTITMPETTLWGGYDPSELAFERQRVTDMNRWKRSYGKMNTWSF